VGEWVWTHSGMSEPVPKSICPAPHTDHWAGVVIKTGPHGGQHAQAVFESDYELNGQKAPDRHPSPDGQTDMPEWVQPPR